MKGIWGPYRDPVFPGWWMNEGGQSATGQVSAHTSLVALSAQLKLTALYS